LAGPTVNPDISALSMSTSTTDHSATEAGILPPSQGQLPPFSGGPVARTESGLAVTIIATVAVIFALDWAQSFFISMLLGVLFAYTLNPLVAWLERARIPRALGTGLVMVGVVGTLAFGAYSLRGQVQTILDQLPEAVSKLSVGLASFRKGETGTMEKVQSAASELEKVADQAVGSPARQKQSASRLVLAAPSFRLGNFVWSGSMGFAGMISQFAMVLFLTFFLLLSGDTYKRRLVRLVGPRWQPAGSRSTCSTASIHPSSATCSCCLQPMCWSDC
jgi:predicted PurR-regulated permease PerM